MKIYKYNNKNNLYDDVLKLYINEINNNPKINLGLATGSTPIPLYERLINSYKEGKVSFKDVTGINLDEYIGISRDHFQSYYNFMYNQLFKHIDINLENTYIPKDEKSIEEFQGILNTHKIDLQLLGIGSNGHIGFNEPGSSFESNTHVVLLDEKTRTDNQRFFNSLDEVPTHAVTMGIKDILEAKMIVVIATGDNKSDAVSKMVDGEVTESLPASVLQKHPNVHLFIDKDAGKLLKGEYKYED